MILDEQEGSSAPLIMDKGVSYCYVKYNNLYLMACTKVTHVLARWVTVACAARGSTLSSDVPRVPLACSPPHQAAAALLALLAAWRAQPAPGARSNTLTPRCC